MTTTIEQLTPLKRRKNALALQAAQYGISVDPHISTELSDLETIISQMELIDGLRARLTVLLRQRTVFGANVPPYVVTEIDDARKQIARLRAVCAKYRQPVGAHPVDEDELSVEQPPTPIPPDPVAHVREQLRDIEAFLRHGQVDVALKAIQQLRREIGG